MLNGISGFRANPYRQVGFGILEPHDDGTHSILDSKNRNKVLAKTLGDDEVQKGKIINPSVQSAFEINTYEGKTFGFSELTQRALAGQLDTILNRS